MLSVDGRAVGASFVNVGPGGPGMGRLQRHFRMDQASSMRPEALSPQMGYDEFKR